MVPHDKILIAIGLVALARGDEQYVRDQLCTQHRVMFPKDAFGQRAFWATEVAEKLPPELYSELMTSQMALTGDFSPVLSAASALGVADVVVLRGRFPELNVPDELVSWRSHNAVRMAIECMMLCNVPLEVISSDMGKMYGRSFDSEYLADFRDLYCDKSRMDWMAYTRCLAPDEVAFKYRLMQEPVEFVRWKLGVPVHLDSETVLDRLMSDAYFTERLMKHEARSTDEHGLPMLAPSDLARIKLERDTIFKCMDRKLKLKEANGANNAAAAAIHAQISEIKLAYTPQPAPSLSDLTDG